MASSLSEKWVLVIDDLEGMRSQLRMSLTSSGFAKLHLSSGIKDALERMAVNRYDIILCDYSLGDSTNGQQFLEYLRTHDLIAHNTIFIMITAEQAYEKVVAAAECAPDDYLLKPFTSAQFDMRLEKLLARQGHFSGIDVAADEQNWTKVIAECDRKLAVKDKYFIDLCKIKSSALLAANRSQEAADLYLEILSMRPIGWAKLGLARAYAKLGKKEEAQELLREILADTPQYMAAYDLLGTLLEQSGDKHAALDVLQKAREISPGTMSRIRELSSIAVSAGKPELAETVMREALLKHKYSPVRQANDYAVLSKALVHQGKASEALSVVADGKKSFTDEHSSVVFSVSESVAHHAAGSLELAEAALEQAMSGGDLNQLSAQAVVSLADACFVLGKEEEGTKLLRHVVQNNQGDDAIHAKVHDVLTAAGKDATEASEMIEDCNKEVILLNNDGVRKAEAGQLAEAIELLCEAADRLPNNMQIVSNAALVIALDLSRNGKDPDKFGKCVHYRSLLINKSPNHPKLVQIDGLLQKLA